MPSRRAVLVGAAALAVALALPASATRARAVPGLFGCFETAALEVAGQLPKARVIRRSLQRYMGSARPAGRVVQAAAGGATAWDDLLVELVRSDRMIQLAVVNAFVNAVPYVPDERNYGVKDYWASPDQFFARGGDCEDYAIAKFVSLARLGLPESRLRIVLVQDLVGGKQHCILAVYLDGTAYILDNQAAAVLPHDRVSRYRPICALNSRELWLYPG